MPEAPTPLGPACPVCRRESRAVLNRFDADWAAELFVSKAVDPPRHARMRDVLATLWGQDHVSVRHCDACDLGFAHPFVAGSAEFYALQAPDTPYPRDKWEYDRTLASLAPGGPAGRTLLEIGAGKGHFLEHLLQRGWSPAQLQATEYAASGRAAIEGRGIACHAGSAADLDPATPFDAICMFQVLEHLDGYDALFGAIGRLAKPGGRLFIAVPNGERIAFNERMGLLPDCPPNHITRWSPRSLGRLADAYGWQLVACEREPPPTRRHDVTFAAINRFLRQTHDRRSWARLVDRIAQRTRSPHHRRDKLIKALGLALSPSTWTIAVQAARATRHGTIPHAIWAELRRPP